MIGAGSWGTAVATLLARGGASVQLVCRTAEQARELATLRTNVGYLPGVTLPDTVTVGTAPTIDWAEADLVCLAVPSQLLPNALESIARPHPRRARRARPEQGSGRARRRRPERTRRKTCSGAARSRASAVPRMRSNRSSAGRR